MSRATALNCRCKSSSTSGVFQKASGSQISSNAWMGITHPLSPLPVLPISSTSQRWSSAGRDSARILEPPNSGGQAARGSFTCRARGGKTWEWRRESLNRGSIETIPCKPRAGLWRAGLPPLRCLAAQCSEGSMARGVCDVQRSP